MIVKIITGAISYLTVIMIGGTIGNASRSQATVVTDPEDHPYGPESPRALPQ